MAYFEHFSIYPSQNHTDSIQIPIPSNTGSLPDLTSVGYPMYPSSLDQEYDHNAHNNSYCAVSKYSSIEFSCTNEPLRFNFLIIYRVPSVLHRHRYPQRRPFTTITRNPDRTILAGEVEEVVAIRFRPTVTPTVAMSAPVTTAATPPLT